MAQKTTQQRIAELKKAKEGLKKVLGPLLKSNYIPQQKKSVQSLKPLAKDIKTSFSKTGEYAGKTLASVFARGEEQRRLKSATTSQEMATQLVKKATQTKDKLTQQRLLKVANDARGGSRKNIAGLAKEYSATPGEMASNIAKTTGYGLVAASGAAAPVSTAIRVGTGAGFGGTLSGVFNKVQGRDFKEGFEKGAVASVPLSGIASSVTNPLISKLAGGAGSKIKGPIGKFLTERAVGAVGAVPEGALFNAEIGAKPFSKESIALDVVSALVFGPGKNARATAQVDDFVKQGGKLGIKGVNPRVFDMSNPDIDRLGGILDVLKMSKNVEEKKQAMSILQTYLDDFVPGWKHTKGDKNAVSVGDWILDAAMKKGVVQSDLPRQNFIGKNQQQPTLQGTPEQAVRTAQEGQQGLNQQTSIAQQQSSLPRTIAPQTLNVNKLALDETGKDIVQSVNTQEVRQTLGDDQVMKIARDAGFDTKTYNIDQTAQKIAEQLNVRRSIVSYTNQFKQETDPIKREQLLKQIAQNSYISRTQGTDIGRQLSARRIIANELDSPMQRVFGLLDKAGVNPDVYTKRGAKIDWDDPYEVVKFYRDLVPATKRDWLDALRYSSMLSSPLTHIVNITGNVGQSGVVAPIEKTLTGAIDFFGSKVSGKQQQHFVGEGASYAKGYAKNVANASKRFIDVMAGKNKYTNVDFDRLPLAPTGKGKYVAMTLEFPTKLLDGMDQFFTALTEGGEKAATSYRLARGATNIIDPIAEAEANARYRIFRQALGDKREGALLQAMDYVPRQILRARSSSNPLVSTVARFTFPFIGTPTNIVKQGVEYSPLGWLTTLGAKNKTEQIAKATMGTATALAGAMLLGSDRLSFDEPREQEEKNAFRAAGKQPYSIKIGDKWVSYNKLAPIVGFNLALVSGLDQAWKDRKTDQNFIDAAIQGFGNISNFYTDQSYFKSMGDLVSAVNGDSDSIGGIPALAANNAKQVLPFRALSEWIARTSDEYQRRPDSDANFVEKQLQSFMTAYPGLRQKVPTRLDSEGNPIKEQNRLINAFSPAKVVTEKPEKMIYLAEEQGARSLAKYLRTLPSDEANKHAERIAEQNPTLYSGLEKYIEIENAGLGDPEFSMRTKGVANGDRAKAVAKQVKKLNTTEERNEYIDKLIDLGIVTDPVFEQLAELKAQGKLD